MPPVLLPLKGTTRSCSLTEGHGLYLEQSLVSEEGAHQLGSLPGGWFQRGGEVDGGEGLWVRTVGGLEDRETDSVTFM